MRSDSGRRPGGDATYANILCAAAEQELPRAPPEPVPPSVIDLGVSIGSITFFADASEPFLNPMIETDEVIADPGCTAYPHEQLMTPSYNSVKPVDEEGDHGHAASPLDTLLKRPLRRRRHPAPHRLRLRPRCGSAMSPSACQPRGESRPALARSACLGALGNTTTDLSACLPRGESRPASARSVGLDLFPKALVEPAALCRRRRDATDAAL